MQESYVEGLHRPYTFEDVEHIARQQLTSYENEFHGKEWVFFDTWLIITRVWFEVVYKVGSQMDRWRDQGGQFRPGSVLCTGYTMDSGSSQGEWRR